MQVNFDPTAFDPGAVQAPTEKVQADKPQAPAARKPSSGKTAEAPKSAPQSGTAASSETPIYGGLLESNVTFRRDSNGQIYYVITDAKSGKELRQVPTEEVRKTGEGIAEYLKREQQKATSRIEAKA